jgi:hypothetical protein
VAIRSLPIIRLNAGSFVATLDYDDANRRMVTVRATNGGPESIRVELRRQSDGFTVGRTFAPGQTATLTLPTSGASRVFLAAVGDGRLEGWDWHIYGLGDG